MREVLLKIFLQFLGIEKSAINPFRILWPIFRSYLYAFPILTLLCVHVFLQAGESGSADTVRDPRGFAMKFYTEDGNWDLVGNNTPIFFIRDAMLVSKRKR